jgi:hypothetical protein
MELYPQRFLTATCRRRDWIIAQLLIFKLRQKKGCHAEIKFRIGLLVYESNASNFLFLQNVTPAT